MGALVDALYQKQILSLAHSARASTLDFTPSQTASCNNPVCGDKVSVSIAIQADRVSNISVDVKGCALCEAGAGLLIETARNEEIDHTKALGADLKAFLCAEDDNENQSGNERAEKLQIFTPVKAIRNRHKCVVLAFDAFNEAVDLFRADRGLVKSP
jgi:nitrogen fixation NifU-like protein